MSLLQVQLMRKLTRFVISETILQVKWDLLLQKDWHRLALRSF